jgi:hypothetical protein
MKTRIAIALLFVLAAGCSSYRVVPRAELRQASELKDVRVATIDGFEYRFSRATVDGDTLSGFYPVTVERSNAKNEVWYEDVLRRHPISLDRVQRVELVRRDPVKTAFYGTTVAAAGFFLGTMVDNRTHASRSSGSGGKGTPGGGIR